ncbi:unnamed protein product [Brassica oleracea var. botrytis]
MVYFTILLFPMRTTSDESSDDETLRDDANHDSDDDEIRDRAGGEIFLWIHKDIFWISHVLPFWYVILYIFMLFLF